MRKVLYEHNTSIRSYQEREKWFEQNDNLLISVFYSSFFLIVGLLISIFFKILEDRNVINEIINPILRVGSIVFISILLRFFIKKFERKALKVLTTWYYIYEVSIDEENIYVKYVDKIGCKKELSLSINEYSIFVCRFSSDLIKQDSPKYFLCFYSNSSDFESIKNLKEKEDIAGRNLFGDVTTIFSYLGLTPTAEAKAAPPFYCQINNLGWSKNNFYDIYNVWNEAKKAKLH